MSDPYSEIAILIARVGELQAEVARLRLALERIASWGELDAAGRLNPNRGQIGLLHRHGIEIAKDALANSGVNGKL